MYCLDFSLAYQPKFGSHTTLGGHKYCEFDNIYHSLAVWCVFFFFLFVLTGGWKLIHCPNNGVLKNKGVHSSLSLFRSERAAIKTRQTLHGSLQPPPSCGVVESLPG